MSARGMDQALRSFLDHLLEHRRLSPHTLRAYQIDLKHWIDDLEDRGIRHLDALNRFLSPLAVRSYISQLYESHERSSLCRRLSAVRSFLRYLKTRGWVSRDVGRLVPSPKLNRPLPRFLKIE